MAKIKVHELATEVGKKNREIIEYLSGKGYDIKTAVNLVPEAEIEIIRAKFGAGPGAEAGAPAPAAKAEPAAKSREAAGTAGEGGDGADKPKKKGIDPLSFISGTAKTGDDCYIGAFAFIGEHVEIGSRCLIYPHAYIGDGVKLGDDCIIYPNVSIYHGCQLGDRVTIHSGSVIGADGFGFAPDQDGYKKIPQLGIVKIEDDVEIGANTCVDRSTMEATVVHKGVKLDN